DMYEADYVGAKSAFIDAILLDRSELYKELKVKKVRNLKDALKEIKKNIEE
ncbi:HAD family hydrolase, partial [Acidianus sp. DSM 29099]|nr:HAD family hydrolase [Acidianus sp. RZ1]